MTDGDCRSKSHLLSSQCIVPFYRVSKRTETLLGSLWLVWTEMWVIFNRRTVRTASTTTTTNKQQQQQQQQQKRKKKKKKKEDDTDCKEQRNRTLTMLSCFLYNFHTMASHRLETEFLLITRYCCIPVGTIVSRLEISNSKKINQTNGVKTALDSRNTYTRGHNNGDLSRLRKLSPGIQVIAR